MKKPPMAKVNEWSIIHHDSGSYASPGDTCNCRELLVTGIVENDPKKRFISGERIFTSTIQVFATKPCRVRTKSTEYRLGKQCPHFKAWMVRMGYKIKDYTKGVWGCDMNKKIVIEFSDAGASFEDSREKQLTAIAIQVNDFLFRECRPKTNLADLNGNTIGSIRWEKTDNETL